MIVKIAQTLTLKMNGNQERFTLYPLHSQALPLIPDLGKLDFFQWSESNKDHIDIQKQMNVWKGNWTVVKLIGYRDLVAIAMAILSVAKELVAKRIAMGAETIP